MMNQTTWGVGVLAMLMVLSVSVSATDKADFLNKRVDHMKKDLSLTDDQAKQIKDILDNTHATADADRKALREKTDQKIEAVLTPEQKAKFEDHKAKMKDKMKHRHHKHESDEAPKKSDM